MRRADRRAQILASAVPVFARHGFRDASLDDIAAEAGITRAVVYRHFDSKEELYRAALDATRAAIRAELQADRQVGPGSVTALIDAAGRDPDRFRLLFEHARHERDFASYYQEFAATSARYVLDALPDGYDTPQVTQFVAHLTTRQMFEAILLWLDQDQPTTPEGARRRDPRRVGRTHPGAQPPRPLNGPADRVAAWPPGSSSARRRTNMSRR